MLGFFVSAINYIEYFVATSTRKYQKQPKLTTIKNAYDSMMISSNLKYSTMETKRK